MRVGVGAEDVAGQSATHCLEQAIYWPHLRRPTPRAEEPGLRTTRMRDLSDTEIEELQARLDQIADAAPELAPLDLSAIDGYLCGVLLQPQPVPEADWLPLVGDAEARPLPSALDATLAALHGLVRRRHAVLGQAIAQRRWFDPWIADIGVGESGSPEAAEAAGAMNASVLPWVAGFDLALQTFPGLLRLQDAAEAALAEPLALLYLHFAEAELEGLEDEPALAEALAQIEPPADLAQAVEDIVRAVLLLADVSRPPHRRAPERASPGPGPRSRSGRRARARPARNPRR